MLLATGVLGAGAALLASGQTWITATTTARGLPSTTQSLIGEQLAPAAFACGLACLAGIAGLLATRGVIRRLVAVVVTGCGVGAVVSVLSGLGSDAALHQVTGASGAGGVLLQSTAWPWVACAGAALATVFGVVAFVRAPRWPGMGRRYDAPRQAASDPETDMWRALDRGDDPTA